MKVIYVAHMTIKNFFVNNAQLFVE